MTQIHVDTAVLKAASGRLRSPVRDAQQRARSLDAVLRELDIEIKAREHFDRRIRDMGTRVSTQAEVLGRHQQHLGWAAGKYEEAEEGLGGAAGSMRTDSEAGGYCPTASEDRSEGASSASLADGLAGLIEYFLGVPEVGKPIIDFLASLGDLTGGKVFQTGFYVLTLDSILAAIEKGDIAEALYEALGLVPVYGGIAKGYLWIAEKMGEIAISELKVIVYGLRASLYEMLTNYLVYPDFAAQMNARGMDRETIERNIESLKRFEQAVGWSN